MNNKEHCTPPLCEVITLDTIGMMAMSGYASDSSDSEFSAPAQRRGTWGNLWSEE